MLTSSPKHPSRMMPRGAVAALMTLAALMALPGQADARGAQGRITFFAKSEVTGARITIDDVARVEGMRDEDLKARVRAADLGATPRPLGERVLAKGTIEAALRSAGVPENVRVTIPKRVVVRRAGQRLAPAQVARQAQIAVEAMAKSAWGEGYEVRVEPVKWRRELLLPSGEVIVEARTRDGKAPQGSSLIEVRFLVDGQEATHKTVSTKIEVVGTLCQAARQIDRGEVLSQSDLIEKRGALTRGAMPCAQLIGQSARSRISMDAVIGERMVEPPRLVKRGERVTITYVSGALRISTRGEALQDGVKGEMINVTNQDSKKVIRGFVEGPGQVRIR